MTVLYSDFFQNFFNFILCFFFLPSCLGCLLLSIYLSVCSFFYKTNQPVAPTPIKPTPSHQIESKSCTFRLTAGVRDLFSSARLIFFLNEEAEEAVAAELTLLTVPDPDPDPDPVAEAAEASEVGFMVMVGSIIAGLYARYNGGITEPSN